MGKRTDRILPVDFSAKLPALVGKNLHVLAKDGITFSGVLESLNAEKIVIRDPLAFWYNFKRRRHNISLNEVKEVLCDRVTDW